MGGKYNPIIPFFKRIPPWWERKGYRFESASQIVNGYLDFFEPDFIVESERGLSNGLGFNQKRVLQLSDVLVRTGDRNRRGHGLGVFDLYKELYHKEFQFVRRHKHNIVDVRPKDRSFELFTSCVFGSFPKSKNLGYFRRAFKDTFDPEQVTLDATIFKKLHKSDHTSALQIGHAKIDVRYNDHNDPALFVLNAHEPKDLIDFWNLRAVRREVMAIPMQWLDDISDFCKDLIKRAHRPLPGNPYGVMIRATVLFKVDFYLLAQTQLRGGATGQPLKRSMKKLLALESDYGAQAFLEAIRHATAHRAVGVGYIENILIQNKTPKREHPPVTLSREPLNHIRLIEPSLAEYDAFVIKRRKGGQ